MELPAEVFADRLCEGECRLVAKIGFTWGVLSTLGVGGWTIGRMYQYKAEITWSCPTLTHWISNCSCRQQEVPWCSR